MTVHRIWYVNKGALPNSKCEDLLNRVKSEIKERESTVDYVFLIEGDSRVEIIETNE